jgi:hypothetical protein
LYIAIYGNLRIGEFFALVGYDLIFCLWQLLESTLFIFLQENDDTVTVESVVSVGEEDCIKVKNEENYKQLVSTVNTEQVSVVCWCIL